MRTGLFVSLAAALTLMISIPSGAQAAESASLASNAAALPAIQCDAGQFCQFKPGTCGRFDQFGTCTPVPKFCTKIFRPSAAATARPTATIATARRRWSPRRMTESARLTERTDVAYRVRRLQTGAAAFAAGHRDHRGDHGMY